MFILRIIVNNYRVDKGLAFNVRTVSNGTMYMNNLQPSFSDGKTWTFIILECSSFLISYSAFFWRINMSIFSQLARDVLRLTASDRLRNPKELHNSNSVRPINHYQFGRSAFSHPRSRPANTAHFRSLENIASRCHESSNMRAPRWPWSIAINMLFTTQMTAVSVEKNGR